MNLEKRLHKNLIVWQKSMDLVVDMYETTKSFPQDEQYGLTSQLRRAAVSVPSNIAEGMTRKSAKDKVHFLNVADGSLSEMDTQIEIAQRLRYITAGEFELFCGKICEVQKLISGLIRKMSS